MGSYRPQTEAQSQHHSSTIARGDLAGEVGRTEVLVALDQWGKGLVSIATAKAENKDYTSVAKKVIQDCYAFDMGEVLFKPTLASKVMFRKTFESALSYFVGGNSQYSEDKGFALNPWVKAEFDIAGIVTGEKHALVMGNKLLTDKTGKVTVANFTMGFIRDKNGALKINLHHSSLPYQPAS